MIISADTTGERHRRVQILTIEELLNGAKPDLPPDAGTFKAAQREQQPPESPQLPLL